MQHNQKYTYTQNDDHLAYNSFYPQLKIKKYATNSETNHISPTIHFS